MNWNQWKRGWSDSTARCIVQRQYYFGNRVIVINLVALNKRLYLFVFSILIAIGASREIRIAFHASPFRQALRNDGFRLAAQQNGFRRVGRRRKTSSTSRRHCSRTRSRWLMTAPLIYRCHFSRIDGIRWYSLCRALTPRCASCIFQRRRAQQKLDNCIIIRWGGGRRSKRDTQKGE